MSSLQVMVGIKSCFRCPHVSCTDGVGAELAAEFNERIMVLDGAMGTMLQRRGLEEEDFRGMLKGV